jgi:hypothetical protein
MFSSQTGAVGNPVIGSFLYYKCCFLLLGELWSEGLIWIDVISLYCCFIVGPYTNWQTVELGSDHYRNHLPPAERTEMMYHIRSSSSITPPRPIVIVHWDHSCFGIRKHQMWIPGRWPTDLSRICCFVISFSFVPQMLVEYIKADSFVYVSILVFWVLMLCGLLGRYQRFGGIYCLHLQGWRQTGKQFDRKISTCFYKNGQYKVFTCENRIFNCFTVALQNIFKKYLQINLSF